MTDKAIEERRRYIEQVKASFVGHNQLPKGDPMDLHTTAADSGFRFFKIKAFIAFLLLAAFIYCDQFDIKYQNYKTKTVIEKLQETIPVENVIQSIENMI